ncbi:MAG: response regulator [Gemmatimonadetes bacterium]|nr:response regulator [Gemmatimonadota bacterium]
MSRKVLIIDDDADFTEAVGVYLETHGYQVISAPNGREGLRLAKAEAPDVVLMDVVMDERTEGFFTLQQLRRTPGLERMPVFVVSSIYSSVPGFSITPEKSWLRHDDFIAKPVDLPRLLELIDARLNQAGTANASGGAA